jgi:hypothetical protein
MRILKALSEEETNQYVRPTLRVNKPAANYARRSNPYAKDKEKDTGQSTEMLTDDLMTWAIDQGWNEELLDPYYADLGLSGTLRPDQRPDMLRLFDNIDKGRYDHGSVICFQENRLFRDETQIYYNQFIDKCKEHDVLVVVISPYLMIYDFRDDFLTEMFRWKCKESADFIKRHIKGWMLPARIRAAWHDGEWAGLGQLAPGLIVDYNPESPTYKKLIPYWPHAEKKRDLYQLFVELGCDISLLYKRLRKTPIIFPEFESWVDKRNISKFGMSRYPGGGYSPKSKATLVAMLTDPNNIGYRPIKGVIRRNRQGEKILDHEPIVELELFDLAYYSLAQTDFDGNPIERKQPKRYFHHHSKGDCGLLKYRIKSNQGAARTHVSTSIDEDTPSNKGFYVIEHPESEHTLYHRIYHAAIPCEELDTIIVNRLMENVRKVSRNHEDIAEYERNAKKQREERQRRGNQIVTSIKDIENKQVGLTISLGQITQEIAEEQDSEKKEIKHRLKELIIEQIGTLERERQKLIQAKIDLDEQADSDLGSLDEELLNLEALWPTKTFEKRRSLLNFLVREVIVDIISTHWIRVQVLWLHEAWGREEMYFWREMGRRKRWTDEEIRIIRTHYANMPKYELMALLPDRSWLSVLWYGGKLLKIPRDNPRKFAKEFDDDTSYSDLEFMRNKGIPLYTRHTNWESLSALAVLMLTS